MSPPGPNTPQGTVVTATATATTCPTPQYEFWYGLSGSALTLGQAYGPSNTFAWSTTGLPNGEYVIQAWLRNQGSTAQSEATVNHGYQLGIPCSGVTLSLSTPTAVLQGDPGDHDRSGDLHPGTPEYEFGAGYNGEPYYSAGNSYGPSNTWVWDTTNAPAGKYSIEVGARVEGSTYDPEVEAGSPSFYVYTTSTDCTVNTLTWVSPSNPNNTAPVGSTVTMQSLANCNAEYEFWVKPPGASTYYIAQAYGSPNGGTFVWNTTGESSGDYQVEVWARRIGTTVNEQVYTDLVPAVYLSP